MKLSKKDKIKLANHILEHPNCGIKLTNTKIFGFYDFSFGNCLEVDLRMFDITDEFQFVSQITKDEICKVIEKFDELENILKEILESKL